MSCGCICLLVFSAYLNGAFLCLTRITYRFKQCNWHHLDAAAHPTGQCHRLLNLCIISVKIYFKSKKENPQKLTQLSSRSHPRHLVGKRTAQKDTIIDITSDSQVNSNFPHRWSPASLTFNNYFYLFLYIYMYIT